MIDILIRDLPDRDVRRIDEKAAQLGLSRAEYLRRKITEDASRPVSTDALTPLTTQSSLTSPMMS